MRARLSAVVSTAAIAAVAVSFNFVNVQAQRGQGAVHGHPPSSVPANGGKPSGAGPEHEPTRGPNAGGKPTVADLLTRNTHLAAELQKLLPGVDLKTASSGFKNLGQFVATVHVSHNLGIPFDTLKGKMTGPNAESLGKAIHELKPDADAKSEAKTASKEADAEIKQTTAQTQNASK